MAAAASGASSEGDFEPPLPSSVEHGGGSDSGQGGGLIFCGDGGPLEPLPSRPRERRSGGSFLDKHACVTDVELHHLTLTICKRIRQWGEGWGWWRWLSGR
jgi:hypothetical protein